MPLSGDYEWRQHKDHEHVRHLLEVYESQERVGTQSSSLAGKGAGLQPAGQVNINGPCATDSDAQPGLLAAITESSHIAKDAESWLGEQYEEDHVRGVDGAYLKYAARLAWQPDQCAR